MSNNKGETSWPEEFYSYATKQFNKFELTKFIDGGGFTLIGAYQVSHKRRMGAGKDGPQVPFLKFIFDEKGKEEYVPLTVNIAMTTRVVEDGVTKFMRNDSHIKHLRPIDINTSDDFYISKEDGLVYEKKSDKFIKVSLRNVYERLYRLHVADIVSLKGVYIRSKRLFMSQIPSVILGWIAWCLGFIVYFIKRDRYKYDVFMEAFLDRRGDDREVRQPTSQDSDIDFFGYKVQLWTLYTYSVLALVFLIVFRRPYQKLSGGQESETIFNIVLATFSIITYDKLIPIALKFIIKNFSIKSYDFKYKSIKLKV